MTLPTISASENGEWANPITSVITHIAVDKGINGVSEYHWERNPKYSVVREFTPADNLRIAQAVINSQTAMNQIDRGTFQEMLNAPDENILFVVQDPDISISTAYDGGYLQRNRNMYKIAKLEDMLSLLGIGSDTVSTETGTDTGTGTSTGTGTGTTTTFGIYGVTVTDQSIQIPDNGFYQIQRVVNDVQTEVFQGEGGVLVEVGDGTYIVINLTTGERTESVTVGSGVYQGTDDNTDDGSDDGTDDGTGTGTTTNDAAVDVGVYGVQIQGSVIFLPTTDYWQIQLISTSEIVFEGNGVIGQGYIVNDGIYNVINLTTAERTENVIISVTDAAIEVGDYGVQIQGDTIILPDDGWYQILVLPNYTEIFQNTGGQSVLVGIGEYSVINLTTLDRTDNVVIG